MPSPDPEPSPILNSPYDETALHYQTDLEGNLDYEHIVAGRRIFAPTTQAIPVRTGPQGSLINLSEVAGQYERHPINQVRREVKAWREGDYPHVTRVSGELLRFWFANPERSKTQQLFFCQREAVETAVWLNEVAGRSNAGQHLLTELRNAQVQDASGLPRIAFKMATGTGKTVVMAMLVLYHHFNRREYPSDTRFADAFLLVAPGVTIRDRLGVLRVDTAASSAGSAQDYYRQRGLVPRQFESWLAGVNSRLVITNFHAFDAKTLKGNKASPFDGKLGPDGKKQVATEDPVRVVRRLMAGVRPGSRVVVMNDEAHHCYLPKAKGGKGDEEVTKEENERAAVWYRGLQAVADAFKVGHVYDLSATPYYLSGSGHEPYSLFPWVVSDFGLIEAIEAGLVKIPFLPESDETHELDTPVLRELFEHVKDELPRKGLERKRSEAKAEGKALAEEPPRIPDLLVTALRQFYEHYERTWRSEGAGQLDLVRGDEQPPVFILVCNNTSVSKEVYKWIAGYEFEGEDGETIVVPGALDLFSNYDAGTMRQRSRPPTLLIDSEALEAGDQVSPEFKKVFEPEIARFKADYARVHGQGALESLTDAQLLREVVNTVGKPGTLGGHIRCVVSVSMLTEGWDANTVTHIVGLRAFKSQLLCEQVAGRALRRRSYVLAKHDRNRVPNPRGETELFPPEYAHIIGVPFKLFKGGKNTPAEPKEGVRVHAIPDRADLEIVFPNVDGYRVDIPEGRLTADFARLEPFEIDGSTHPFKTVMGTAVSGDTDLLEVESLRDLRDQQVVYRLARAVLHHYYRDEDGRPMASRFGDVRGIVEEWYETRVRPINVDDPFFRRILYYWDSKRVADHINRAIRTGDNGEPRILPVFNHYNRDGRTRFVDGWTTKPTYPTTKSHVNLVVADTGSWEQIAAKTLEEMDEVEAYVKNEFLGFTIPYTADDGRDRRYFPDFIARVRTAGGLAHLVIEITGMNRDKTAKKWAVEERWLPAVNATADRHEFGRWAFVEIAGDIRPIKEELRAAMSAQFE